MADLTVSSDIDTMMQAANFAGIRSALGLGALSTVTPGTGVATALAFNVGSAGAFVVLGGAGGTPSAIVLTNGTGLVATTGLTATGTKNNTTFLRGDNTWDVPAGSGTGDVTGPGSSTDNAIVVFDGATGKIVQNSVAILDPLTGDLSGIGSLSATDADFSTLTLGIVQITATGTELNFVDGVTSAIQTQLDAKAPLASPTFTGTVTLPAVTLGGTIAGAGQQLNNIIIGTTTPLAGTFTTLVAGSGTSILVGTAGSAVGSVGFRNATSGTITISPTTGALGTIAIVVPANAGTIAVSATSVTATQAMFATATAGAPAFRAIAAGDLPSTLTSGTAITNAALTTPVLGTPTSGALTNCTADGTNAVGYRNVPQNAKTGSYTLLATDVGKVIPNTTGGWTVNNSVHAAGDVISVYNDSASSQNITAGTITTMRLAGTATTGTRALAARGLATLYFQTATEVVVSGGGVT